MLKKGIGETIKEAAKAKTVGEKVTILQSNSSKTMKTIFEILLTPDISWRLPSGTPPYNRAEKGMDLQGKIHRQMKKIDYFLHGSPRGDNLKGHKMEQMFIQMLESVDPDDADLIIAMKDKKLPQGITEKVVFSAFPLLAERVRASRKETA